MKVNYRILLKVAKKDAPTFIEGELPTFTEGRETKYAPTFTEGKLLTFIESIKR